MNCRTDMGFCCTIMSEYLLRSHASSFVTRTDLRWAIARCKWAAFDIAEMQKLLRCIGFSALMDASEISSRFNK